MTTEKAEALIQQHMTVGLSVFDTDEQRMLAFNYDHDGSMYASFSFFAGSDDYKPHPDEDIDYHLAWFKSQIGPIQPDTEETIRALTAEGWRFLVMLRRSWRRSQVVGSIELVLPGDAPLLLDVHIGHLPKTEDDQEET